MVEEPQPRIWPPPSRIWTKINWQDGSIFRPFDMSKANSKISCVVKLSVNLSRGCFFPCIRRCFCLRGCFEHVCDSVAVDSVIYPYMLWSSVPCGLALAYCRGYFARVVQGKKALVDGEGGGRGSEPRNKEPKPQPSQAKHPPCFPTKT